MSSGPRISPNVFIVMDRLFETLDVKMKHWADLIKCSRGGVFGLRKDGDGLKKLLLERLIVSYDLSQAFRYMHENKYVFRNITSSDEISVAYVSCFFSLWQRLVYRDIKLDNIGFDIRGDVKVFDFGLSRSLSKSLRAKDSRGKHVYGYNLTPRTGSIPYMAPEVVEAEPYDTKCDVFSFSILLWEIMALKLAYKGYTRREFLYRVVRAKERMAIKREWPPLTRLAIQEAWEHDPQKRPNMTRIAEMLRGDMNEMSDKTLVRQRTIHMRDRSMNSFHLNRKAISPSGKNFT